MRILLRTLLFLLVTGVAQAGPSIIGTWSGIADGEPLTVTFAADGTGTANGEAMRWQVMGALLFVEQDGAVSTYQVQQDGDRLRVAGGNFVSVVTLGRGAPAKAPATSAPKVSAGGGGGGSGGAGSAGGSAGSELVGKWCKGGAFSAVTGGGSSSMTCFELKADGTYSYEHEGSISAYGSGYYGGTASQSSDRGHWSVSGNVLVARSANGGESRYRLEKRNHPKNHRDPMICLDGDCYVTYWQKTPW